MLNFKKLASTFIFSILAFQSTACAVPRYAKVVLLGGKGSGKTTIQKLINKDYNIENIPHTTQISYISVPVFYDNKGNFTFDEDRDVQRYNKEVILNICDTPSANDIEYDYNTEEYKKQAKNNEKLLKCVDEFANKRSNLIVFLADGSKFDFDETLNFKPDYSFVKCLSNLKEDCDDVGKLFILTNSDVSYQSKDALITDLKIKYLQTLKCDIHSVYAVSALTLDKEDSDEDSNSDNTKNENEEARNKARFTVNSKGKMIAKEINLNYTAQVGKLFNKDSKEGLRKYADIILNLIARSVYKYGINNLPLDNNDSDWTIIDGKLVKGH